MGQTDKRIDAYIMNALPFAQPILNHIRALVHAACPEVAETMKWSFPHFMYNKEILASMASFKSHAVFGFWKGSVMEDPDDILSTENRTSMGHLGQLTQLKDLPKDAVMKKYIKQAMKLSEQGVKLPQRQRPAVKTELVMPDYFTQALTKNKNAQKHFEAFNYSSKKEYLEWLEEAKTDATRAKRLATTIEWLEEGKKRHWKYQDC